VSGDMAAQNYFTSGAAPALGGAPGFGDD